MSPRDGASIHGTESTRPWPTFCRRCDGHGEVCVRRGATVEDDEYIECSDCGGLGQIEEAGDA